MTLGLIIIAAILVASVIAHFFFWRSSQKKYTEFMKHVEALQEKLKEHEASDMEIDKMLDNAQEDMQRIDEEINALRSVWFVKQRKKSAIDN